MGHGQEGVGVAFFILVFSINPGIIDILSLRAKATCFFNVMAEFTTTYGGIWTLGMASMKLFRNDN